MFSGKVCSARHLKIKLVGSRRRRRRRLVGACGIEQECYGCTHDSSRMCHVYLSRSRDVTCMHLHLHTGAAVGTGREVTTTRSAHGTHVQYLILRVAPKQKGHTYAWRASACVWAASSTQPLHFAALPSSSDDISSCVVQSCSSNTDHGRYWPRGTAWQTPASHAARARVRHKKSLQRGLSW